jgi:4-alpha-glucanotransferase
MTQETVARTAIVPFQDVLGLGNEARMNLPGTTDRNWSWRFSWDQVTEEQAEWLAGMAETYGRTGQPMEGDE